MSHSNTFIPGKWLDQIDVTDFVNLNKKPFLSSPLFLRESLSRVSSDPPDIPAPLSSDFDEQWKRSVSTDIKKAIRIGLLPPSTGMVVPSMVHPDVRMVPLYGTQKLIQDKKYFYKQLEDRFQTTEWIERRLALQMEIDALKAFASFASSRGQQAETPSRSAREACEVLWLSALYAWKENPLLPFSLPDLTAFLDVFIEQDLQTGRLKEEEAQELIETLIVRLSPLLREGRMTLLLDEPTKTTYRWLKGVAAYPQHAFPLSMVASSDLHPPLLSIMEGLPLPDASSLHHLRAMLHPHQSILHHGAKGIIGHDIVWAEGGLDLLSLFYLTVNGGKDVATNTNLLTHIQPFKQDRIPYEEVYQRFCDALLYGFTLYSKTANHMMYLTEQHGSTPFRSGLLTTFPLYKIQFSLERVMPVLTLLSAIRNDTYRVERNAKGWITVIHPTAPSEDEEDLFAPLMVFLHDQIQRLPFYKNGKGMIRIMDEELPYTLPPEYIPLSFSSALPSDWSWSSLWEEERLEYEKKRTE